MLHKWWSNSPQVLDSIPEELREKYDLTIREPDSASKTLVIHWSTKQECFYIHVPELLHGPAFKRTITAAAARTFDLLRQPCSLSNPSFNKQLWLMGRGWDEPALLDIQEHFDIWRNELHYLKKHPVPRRLVQHESPVLSHGFSDASQACYGAITYMKNLHSDPWKLWWQSPQRRWQVSLGAHRPMPQAPGCSPSLSVDVHHCSQPEDP